MNRRWGRPTGTGVHVSIEASDAAGPIVGANAAIRLVLTDERTLSVTRATTDLNGKAHQFVPIDWVHLGAGASLTLNVRLSPHEQSGPYLPGWWCRRGRNRGGPADKADKSTPLVGDPSMV